MTLRILLADDDDDVRRNVRTLLEREGFEVVAEARDGNEAINLAEATLPDVAVLDLSMPGLDGINGARGMAVKGLRTRVVLLTCHVQAHEVVRALRGGVTAYVVKAEVVEHLGSAVREVSRGRVFLSPLARHIAADHVEENDGVLSLCAK